MHRYNFYSYINITTSIKKCMFYMQIILNREIFSKLYLYGHTFFYKIYLIICSICSISITFYDFALFLCILNIYYFLGCLNVTINIIIYSTFLPTTFYEFFFK